MKITKFTRVLACLLAAVMLVLTLGACGEEAPAAITYKDITLTANQYCFWMSRYKAMFLLSYFGTQQDNPQYWATEMSEGVTLGTWCEMLALANIMTNVSVLQLFNDYGLELSKDELNAIDAQIDAAITNAGSKASLNSQLSQFGVNVNMLKEIYTMEAKIQKVQNYLYGPNGVDQVTEAEIDEYYKANYYRTKYIFISSVSEYETDDKGAWVVDKATGAYKTREMTAEEKAAKKSLFDDLSKRAAAGEDFDKMVLEHTMDSGMLYFTEGYYFNSASTYVQPIVMSTVMEMNVGDVKAVENDKGWFIVKRYELGDKPYNEDPYKTNMFGDLSTQIQTVKLNELVGIDADQINVNKEVTSLYPLAYCTADFYY